MGMTIDEAMAKIWHCIVSIRECVGNKDFVKALETAIDTMRKYQKIQEIAEKHNLKLLPKEGMGLFMKDVLEVLEDGNG